MKKAIRSALISHSNNIQEGHMNLILIIRASVLICDLIHKWRLSQMTIHPLPIEVALIEGLV